MRIGALKETVAGEQRVAMTPDSALQLQKLGHECFIQSGAGENARFSDDDYAKAGVTVVKTVADLIKSSDVVVKVRPTTSAELKKLKKGRP